MQGCFFAVRLFYICLVFSGYARVFGLDLRVELLTEKKLASNDHLGALEAFLRPLVGPKCSIFGPSNLDFLFPDTVFYISEHLEHCKGKQNKNCDADWDLWVFLLLYFWFTCMKKTKLTLCSLVSWVTISHIEYCLLISAYNFKEEFGSLMIIVRIVTKVYI